MFFFAVVTLAVAYWLSQPYLLSTPDRQSQFDRYFSNSYKEARSSFLSASKALEEQLGSEKCSLHSVEHKEKGKDGEVLATDILWLGSRTPTKVLFHSSGVHGVEGYVGSAVQLNIIDVLSQHADLLAGDIAVVLIHVVNPHGMSWWRRWNPANVDLNRNFLTDEEWNLSKPNPGYEMLRQQLSPNPFHVTIQFFFTSAVMVAKLGYSGAAQAFAGGQYNDPQGVYFGGNEPQPELVNILAYLSKHFSLAQHYIALDVHSGLGPSGHDMLMTSESKSEWAKEMGDHVDADDQKPKLYQVIGGFPEGLKAFFSTSSNFFKIGDKQEEKEARVLSTKSFYQLTQEFGTKAGVLVANALYEENFYYHNNTFQKMSGKQIEEDPTKLKLLSAFYLRDNDWWKEKVLTRGLWLFQTNLRFLTKHN